MAFHTILRIFFKIMSNEGNQILMRNIQQFILQLKQLIHLFILNIRMYQLNILMFWDLF